MRKIMFLIAALVLACPFAALQPASAKESGQGASKPTNDTKTGDKGGTKGGNVGACKDGNGNMHAAGSKVTLSGGAVYTCTDGEWVSKIKVQ